MKILPTLYRASSGSLLHPACDNVDRARYGRTCRHGSAQTETGIGIIPGPLDRPCAGVRICRVRLLQRMLLSCLSSIMRKATSLPALLIRCSGAGARNLQEVAACAGHGNA